MKNFIKTSDKETADKLIAEGFVLVSQNGNVYTFLNQFPKNFVLNETDKKHLVYDNILCL